MSGERELDRLLAGLDPVTAAELYAVSRRPEASLLARTQAG